MRKWLILLLLAAAAAPVSASTTSFSATLNTVGGTVPKVFLRLSVLNCGDYIPLVSGAHVIANPDNTFDLFPNISTGVISATIDDQASITCGSSLGVAYYHIDTYQGDQTTSTARRKIKGCDFDITGPSFNLNTATCRSGGTIIPPFSGMSVTNFGAYSGATDNAPAFQAAATAACASNGSRQIYIPGLASGIFNIVVPNNGVAVQINCPGVSFISDAGFRLGPTPSAAGAQLAITGGPGVVFQIALEKKQTVTTIARAANVVTATLPALSTGQGSWASGRSVTVASCTDGTFNGTFTLSTATTTQLTWPQVAGNASTTACVVTEAYDAAGVYDGFEGTRFLDITASCAGSTPLTNGFGNYCGGVTLFKDWRGGDVRIRAHATGFDYAFWGIQSDINKFEIFQLRQNEHGIYLGPHSDQNELYAIYALHNDNTLTLDGAAKTKLFGGVDNSSGSSSTSPIKLMGSYVGTPTTGTMIHDFWPENSQGQTATAINSFIDIGTGAAAQVTDTYIDYPFDIDRTSPNTPRTKYLVSMDNGEGLFITAPLGQLTDSLVEFKGSTSPFRVRIQQDRLVWTTPVVNNGSGTPQAHCVGEYNVSSAWLMSNCGMDAAFDALRIQAGGASDQSARIRWMNRSGVTQFYIEKSSVNNFNIVDAPANSNRLALVVGGSSGLNSVGATANRFNVDNPSGTGGSVFGDGAGNIVGSIDSTGKGTFNGGVVSGAANTFTNVAAPSTPAAGKTAVYADSTNKVFSSKNDAGTISNTVVPSTAPANQYANSVSAAGVVGYQALVSGDIPSNAANTTGSARSLQGASGATLQESSDVWSEKRSTNAQTHQVYNTDDGAGNAEYGSVGWSGNIFGVFSNKTGTGTQRTFQMGLPGVNTWQLTNGSLFGPTSDNSKTVGTTGANRPSTYYAGTSYVLETAANGAQWTKSSASELLTLSTSGTTTDTAANLLPANSIIEAVEVRITTTITTATNWSVGDPTTAARFCAANATLTAGTTSSCLTHVDQTGAAGPKQTAAAKVRITTTGTPGAGAIRITVFYRTFTPPTS